MENSIMAEYHNQLREWAPLTDLLNKLPRKVQTGITSHEVNITCIDVVSDFIALGTNLGVVYWYNRTKRTLQRLRCEDSLPVTTITVISTVDYMLACGNTAGSVNIFQIPKSHPDNIPTNLKPKNQQIERYLVSEMHKSSISALTWSKNGMKLFSGDRTGIVVFTELDFYMHICKSVEILNETYKVVQLSYYQHNLLISTTYRSIICQKRDKWNITQIGKKDRKTFGEYGGIIYSDTSHPNNFHLYCSRPGLRIWISDSEGNVQKTLLFKDILNKQDVPVNSHLKLLKNTGDVSFSRLLTFQDGLLVTFCRTVLYVLDPYKMTVLYKMHSLKGILGVATTKEEIFILEEQKNVVRLAYKPESTNEETCFALPTNSTNWLPSSIRMLGVTLDGCAITPNKESDYTVNFDTTTVVNAEEALECTESPESSHNSDTKILQNNETTRNIQKYNKISEEDYDDSIIFKHRKPPKSIYTANSLSSSVVQNMSTARGTLMNLSTVSMLPDLRSPESIKSDIESKEKIIAEILDFNKVKIDTNSLKLNGHHVMDNGRNDRVTSIQSKSDEMFSEVNQNKNIPTTKNFNESERNDKEVDKDFSTSDIVNEKINESSTIPDMVNLPTFAQIPSDWNLSCVKLNADTPKIESDNFLNDWEII